MEKLIRLLLEQAARTWIQNVNQNRTKPGLGKNRNPNSKGKSIRKFNRLLTLPFLLYHRKWFATCFSWSRRLQVLRARKWKGKIENRTGKASFFSGGKSKGNGQQEYPKKYNFYKTFSGREKRLTESFLQAQAIIKNPGDNL